VNKRWRIILGILFIIGFAYMIALGSLRGIGIFAYFMFLFLLLALPFLPLFSLLFPKNQHWALVLNWVFTGLSLGSFIFLYWFFVEVFGDSGPSLAELVLAPFPLIPAICAMVAARAYRSRVSVALLTVFFIALLVMVFTDYTPMKPFSRLRDSIHDGMTQADIFAALQREFPPNGLFAAPAVYFTAEKIEGGGPSMAEQENSVEKGPYAAPLDSFKEGEIHLSLHPDIPSHGEDNVMGSWAFYMRDGRVIYSGR
jgi:hypothetical protein